MLAHICWPCLRIRSWNLVIWNLHLKRCGNRTFFISFKGHASHCAGRSATQFDWGPRQGPNLLSRPDHIADSTAIYSNRSVSRNKDLCLFGCFLIWSQSHGENSTAYRWSTSLLFMLPHTQPLRISTSRNSLTRPESRPLTDQKRQTLPAIDLEELNEPPCSHWPTFTHKLWTQLYKYKKKKKKKNIYCKGVIYAQCNHHDRRFPAQELADGLRWRHRLHDLVIPSWLKCWIETMV